MNGLEKDVNDEAIKLNVYEKHKVNLVLRF